MLMVRARGQSGALRVGYQWAADLGPWTLTLEPVLPRTFRATAQRGPEHSYWSTQRPLDLVLHLAGVDWIWRGIEIARSGDRGELVTILLRERPIVEAAVMAVR